MRAFLSQLAGGVISGVVIGAPIVLYAFRIIG